MPRRCALALPLVLLACPAAAAKPDSPASFKLAGPWAVRVSAAGAKRTLRIAPPVILTVVSEKYTAIPLFNPKAGGWAKGAQLQGLKAQETTSPHLLDPRSFALRAGPSPDSPLLTKGADYEADLIWGTFGRLPGGKIEEQQHVYAAYRHAQQRLDAVVLTAAGKIELRPGVPRAAAPVVPRIQPGERHLGNIYLPGGIDKLALDHLFPILETAYPTPPPSHESAAITRITRRLKAGQPLRILAWGDSVTDAAYVSNQATERWQEQFAKRLRERFPQARIELVTQAWGGRSTGSYLAEPPGSAHNYQETVLNVKPDVVISEFVNDSSMTPERVAERYSKILADFQAIGAEWIILTPHYTRPDWMNLTRERDVDQDPRPYVAALRQFAATHDVALADASLRYGRLWRQGIPHSTLMLNAINHPNPYGLGIFADALMALFP